MSTPKFDPSSKRSRMRGVFVVLLLSLVVAVWICYAAFDQAKSAAATAAQDLAECNQLGLRITALRRRPSLAGSRELQITELAQRLEEAARSCSIPADGISRISPDAPHRVGDSPYREVATDISLRQVTLRQAISFLHTLCSAESGLRARDLRLEVPHDVQGFGSPETGTTAQNTWTLEATLSYLIYAPAGDATHSHPGIPSPSSK